MASEDVLELSTTENGASHPLIASDVSAFESFAEAFDWTTTPLGEAVRWSASLKTAVGICMKSRFPMIIFWGPDFVQIYNEAYMPILGDKHPMAYGQRASDCWPEIWDAIGPMLAGVVANNKATWAENLLLPLRRSGQLEDCYFTFSYSPIDDSGSVGGVFCAVTETTATVMRDRDAQQQVQAMAELDRSKTFFFNSVSHELRTPLTLMLGPLAELMNEADESQLPLLETAQRNSLRLLRLVNTLLDFARVESGKATAELVSSDLGAVTEEMISLFRGSVEILGLKLKSTIAFDKFVPVDRLMWEKIVLNLLSNAVKFTVEGEIRVSLIEARGFARLTVEDTGIGIAGEDQPRIFERFYRAHDVGPRSHEGSGIGLALVSEFVQLHDGTIRVESQVGVGSKFVVEIPLRAMTEGNAESTVTSMQTNGIVDQYVAELNSMVTAHSDAISVNERSIANEGSILVVDDNRDLRAYLSRVLMPGFEVETARNGADALARLAERSFDLIICDVMMPGMDGHALLQAVRSDERLQEVRFIFLTARAGGDFSQSALDAGADDYLTKPFSAEDLLARARVQVRAARRDRIRERREIANWFEKPGDPTKNEIAFQVFADQLPIMIFQQDVDGAISFTNKTWYETLRLPHDPSSHTLDAWLRVIHPKDTAQALALISRAIPTRSAFQFDYRLRPADSNDDGAYRWHTSRGVPNFAADGTFRGWTGSVIDIHEARLREDAERSLRIAATQGESDFHALADTIPVIVWTADKTGALTWYNSRWYEYTGLTPGEADGWAWQRVPHPDDISEILREWPASVATGTPYEMEYRLRRHDGEYRTFLARAVPIRDQMGNVIRWYGSNIDIQVQKDSIERSRSIAATLQGVLLPATLSQSATLRVDVVYQTSENDTLIGGDWYDAIQLPDGRHLLSIGDVSGHGIESSVIAARLRHAIVDYSMELHSPVQVLKRTNDILRLEHDGVYATAFVGFIDADGSGLEYASAGHPAAFLSNDARQKATPLQTGGIPLGVQRELFLVPRHVALTPSAVIALYTDGLIEFDRKIIESEEKLASLVSRLGHDLLCERPAEAIRDAMLEGKASTDDLVLMIVQLMQIDYRPLLTIDRPDSEKTWRFHSSDPYTAHSFRHELIAFIQNKWNDEAMIFNAEIVIGEILANTVEHAPGIVDITLRTSNDTLFLTVSDEGEYHGNPSGVLPDSLDESGRGLYLVRTLASDFRFEVGENKRKSLHVVLSGNKELGHSE